MCVVTDLRLTNSRFCTFYVEINHFEAHLIASAKTVDFKVLRMAVEVFVWENGKVANVMLEISDTFFNMSADVPLFQVHVFASDFEFWNGVSGY